MGRVLAFPVGERATPTAERPPGQLGATVVILPVVRIERVFEPATGTDGAATPNGGGRRPPRRVRS